VERVKDPTLAKGKTVKEEEGAAPTRTSASREVYSADGELIRSETWSTSYDGEERIVRVGTKAAPKKTKPVSTVKPPAKTSATPPATQP